MIHPLTFIVRFIY